MKPIILVGGGGHCKSVIEAAESSGREIKGILDTSDKVGLNCLGYPVVGTDVDIPAYVEDYEFVVTIGFIKDPALRVKLHGLIESSGGTLATIVASSAHISKYAEIQSGTVVLHGAKINAGCRIGKGCIINTLANIEHDVNIADFCHVSTGAMVNGDVSIGEGTFIGSGSVINNGVKVTSKCVIASGSVVNKNLNKPGRYAGVPVSRI